VTDKSIHSETALSDTASDGVQCMEQVEPNAAGDSHSGGGLFRKLPIGAYPSIHGHECPSRRQITPQELKPMSGFQALYAHLAVDRSRECVWNGWGQLQV
jgi:hypothetical protein